MKTKCYGSFANVRLMESDPSAYFEKLLQQLNELEERVDGRNEVADALPEERGGTASGNTDVESTTSTHESGDDRAR